MLPDGKLLAWITPKDEDAFLAAFVGSAALHVRAPATQLCSSCPEARRWVEDQAGALGLPVEWMSKPPKG